MAAIGVFAGDCRGGLIQGESVCVEGGGNERRLAPLTRHETARPATRAGQKELPHVCVDYWEE